MPWFACEDQLKYFRPQKADKKGSRTTSTGWFSTFPLSQKAGRVTNSIASLFSCLSSEVLYETGKSSDRQRINSFSKDLVGAGRFERPTPCAQGRCATRLRYAPTCEGLFILKHFLTRRSPASLHLVTPKPILDRPSILDQLNSFAKMQAEHAQSREPGRLIVAGFAALDLLRLHTQTRRQILLRQSHGNTRLLSTFGSPSRESSSSILAPPAFNVSSARSMYWIWRI